MIEELTIKNFKSHEHTQLKLSNLNIFTGLNGTGKSSVIQALLLLRQSYQKRYLVTPQVPATIFDLYLDLNQPLCDIGTTKDALYAYAREKIIEFSIKSDNESQIWQFEVRDNNLNDTSIEGINLSPNFSAELALFRTKSFQYLSAKRLAPQESYLKDSLSVERDYLISKEYGQGELIAHFLSIYGEKRIADNVRHPDCMEHTIQAHTQSWLREISPNINFEVSDNDENYEIIYRYNTRDGFPTPPFKTQNVGFGITYTLSVIVALLSGSSLIIIENPEAHIHPRGQAKLAELIALVASTGTQLIIETHSDHIINGVLVAVKKQQLAHDKVRIHYFDRDDTKHATVSTEIPVHEGGIIKSPPAGFFDQIRLDRKVLMGF